MAVTTVKCLNVLAVYVTDIARSEAFYRDHLGFEKVADLEPGILMEAGEVKLFLEGCREKQRSEKPATAEFSPWFSTDSVRGAYHALKKAGVPISTEYQEFAPTFALFRISDPDGNLIEFAGAP
ncbi:MAG: hypothetical protein GF388_06450 [Candidatus Aegiribacteria sp.]|nr:hypothetical protein [Candidatus Aegiribacteria sp.]MBD3294799.1 hypothetical protein [Candidatus Fermentibacteria bacterium]